MTHSPGPWHVYHGGSEWSITRDKHGREEIARVHIRLNQTQDGSGGLTEGLPDANAFLIAAAPSLLKRLEEAEQTLRNLAIGDLTGDARIIARNCAWNCASTIADARRES